jgi:hypothetical protein
MRLRFQIFKKEKPSGRASMNPVSLWFDAVMVLAFALLKNNLTCSYGIRCTLAGIRGRAIRAVASFGGYGSVAAQKLIPSRALFK